MSEYPIICRADVVRNILSGRQTQDRRPLKPQPTLTPSGMWKWKNLLRGKIHERGDLIDEWPRKFPWKAGDILWVRENYWIPSRADNGLGIQFDADVSSRDLENAKRDLIPLGWKHKPSIHMPRWACRLFLDVSEVRVERLQDISEEDAKKEGVKGSMTAFGMLYMPMFSRLWDSIYGSWTLNPWVIVTDFRRKI